MNTGNEKKIKGKFFLIGILSGAAITAILALVLGIGIFIYQENTYNAALTAYKTAESVDTAENQLMDQETVDKAEMLYTDILQVFYFEEDIDTELMRDNIYKAIVDSLGDPYAAYYTAEELDEMLTDSEGTYYGIGSYVSMDSETGYAKLSGIFKNSPAEEAGLRDGDLIIEADGENLAGLTLDEVTAKIKGPEGTTVELTVYREGEESYLYFTVERRKVENQTVNYEMKDNGIGYIQITEFDDVTLDQFKNAYSDLNTQGMKAMVLDLRSNPGGNLDTVLDIAREMLPEGVITYTLDKSGNREDYMCEGASPITIPAVILVNGYSASASELLTGAMHDYGLATVIGTNTYGKGIVQSIYPLTDGSGIKLTTSRYYTPNGVCIHETGIAPDIEVEFDSEAYYAEESVDNQLEYAINYLTESIGN